jgi:hypothetical protein
MYFYVSSDSTTQILCNARIETTRVTHVPFPQLHSPTVSTELVRPLTRHSLVVDFEEAYDFEDPAISLSLCWWAGTGRVLG